MKQNSLYNWVRILLGLGMLAFGLNVFLQFMPAPEFNEAGSAFLGALFAVGYVFPLMGIAKIIFGLSLLSNRYVALLSLVFLPFTINFLLFHFALDMAGVAFALVIAILHFYVIWANAPAYRPMLKK